MTEQTEVIPYVILEAHPDYKRPYASQMFGYVERNKLESVILQKLVEFVYDKINIEKVKSEEDIETFWEKYYSDYSGSYMDMCPWEASAFINGKWQGFTPTDFSLLKELKKLKKRDENTEMKEGGSSESDESDESEEEEETLEDTML